MSASEHTPAGPLYPARVASVKAWHVATCHETHELSGTGWHWRTSRFPSLPCKASSCPCAFFNSWRNMPEELSLFVQVSHCHMSTLSRSRSYFVFSKIISPKNKLINSVFQQSSAHSGYAAMHIWVAFFLIWKHGFLLVFGFGITKRLLQILQATFHGHLFRVTFSNASSKRATKNAAGNLFPVGFIFTARGRGCQARLFSRILSSSLSSSLAGNLYVASGPHTATYESNKRCS